MKLTNTPYRIRCEMGACKNIAVATVRPERVGVLGGLHLCDACMRQMRALFNARYVASDAAQAKSKGGKGE